MDGGGPEAARRIARLKRDRDALILAHNYQRPEVQDVADYTGDSLELSRIAAEAGESVIVFCGVRFMAETAAILCPGKTVLLPVPEAGCALADAAYPDQVRKARIQHPDAVVVSYVNTSAEVKAESDLCCTSANAVDVLRSVERKRPILFVSDRHLGRYAARMTGRKVILWDGSCPTHAALCVADIVQARDRYPHAKVMVHPECQSDVLKIADRVTGTAGMLAYAAQQASSTAFIVGTDIGLIHRLRKENPDKTFYPVTDYLVCPTMKLTTLGDVIRSLETMTTKVKVADRTRLKARVALDAMLNVGSRKALRFTGAHQAGPALCQALANSTTTHDPQEANETGTIWERGYVHVYTGNGKGKTTAAIGLAVRAAGAGLRVFIGQFAKGGKPSSEITALKRFDDCITLRQFGRGCFIRSAPEVEDIRLAEAGLAEARKAIGAGQYEMVILDEANVAVQLGLFPVERLLELIAAKPERVELVLTGRGADPAVVQRADVVTDMGEVKHYYRRGILARDGIECYT